MLPLRPGSRDAWITTLDAAVIACASAALVVILGGRTRLSIGAVRLAFRTPANLIIFGAVGALLRVWVARGIRWFPSLNEPAPGRLEAQRARFISTAVRPPHFTSYTAAVAL